MTTTTTRQAEARQSLRSMRAHLSMLAAKLNGNRRASAGLKQMRAVLERAEGLVAETTSKRALAELLDGAKWELALHRNTLTPLL